MTPEERRRLEELLSDAAGETPPVSLRERVLFGRARGRPRTRRPPTFPGKLAWAAALGAVAAMVLLMMVRPAPPRRSPPPAAAAAEGAPPPAPEVPAAPPSASRRPDPPTASPPAAPVPSIPAADPVPEAPTPSPTPPPPAGPPTPRPPPVEPDPTGPAPVKGTRPAVRAVAILREAEGSVEVAGEPARPGQGVAPGQGVWTGPAGRAVLLFEDGTRLSLAPETTLRRLEETRGKRVELEGGTLAADVTRQPAGSTFVVLTPHAEAAVVGTRFTLVCRPDSTRLDVEEGQVRLRRLSDGASAAVSAGRYAVASPASRPAALPRPPAEIVLLPAQGSLSGAEWRLVPDPAASSGAALETTRFDEKTGGMKTSRSFVTFAFHAEADRDYRVWVRGKVLETRDAPAGHDAVAILPLSGRFDRPCADRKTQGTDAYLFNGFGDDPALRGRYFWIGGNGLGESVTLRFSRPGLQRVQLHAMESPVRIDAIWLSTAQADRPEPDAKPLR